MIDMNAPMQTLFGGTNPGELGPPIGERGQSNIGICTLSFAGRVFKFRTNPNEVWWSYELLQNVEYTYGGQVVQLLGTRLGDLRVKIECGWGGWDYLVQVAMFLRDLLADQRGGNTATFYYSTRNWLLNVYGMTIPYSDQLTATTREIEITFKIQEDINGVVSQVTLDAEINRLSAGIYQPNGGALPHNEFDDPSGVAGNLDALTNSLGIPLSAISGDTMTDPQTPSGPTYSPVGVVNTVDDSPEGDALDALGLPIGDITQALNIPDVSLPGAGPLPIGDD